MSFCCFCSLFTFFVHFIVLPIFVHLCLSCLFKLVVLLLCILVVLYHYRHASSSMYLLPSSHFRLPAVKTSGFYIDDFRALGVLMFCKLYLYYIFQESFVWVPSTKYSLAATQIHHRGRCTLRPCPQRRLE